MNNEDVIPLVVLQSAYYTQAHSPQVIREEITMEQQTMLHTAYVIHTDDFTDIVCEDCAVKFAEENNLTWYANEHDWTKEEEGIGVYSNAKFSLGESDYPYSCECDGKYLKTHFTPEGVSYVLEGFPSWVADLYEIKKGSNE